MLVFLIVKGACAVGSGGKTVFDPVHIQIQAAAVHAAEAVFGGVVNGIDVAVIGRHGAERIDLQAGGVFQNGFQLLNGVPGAGLYVGIGAFRRLCRRLGGLAASRKAQAQYCRQKKCNQLFHFVPHFMYFLRPLQRAPRSISDLPVYQSALKVPVITLSPALTKSEPNLFS